jgi:hypothetical protein
VLGTPASAAGVIAGREPEQLVSEFPVVPLESLLAATVPSVTTEGFGYDPARGELWFAGETAEAVLLELQARRRELSAEADDLDARAGGAAQRAEEAEQHARAAEIAFGRVAPRLRRSPVDPRTLDRLIGAADRLAGAVTAAQTAASRLEPTLRARVDVGARKAGELGEELRRLRRRGENFVAARGSATTPRRVELARLEAEARGSPKPGSGRR